MEVSGIIVAIGSLLLGVLIGWLVALRAQAALKAELAGVSEIGRAHV